MIKNLRDLLVKGIYEDTGLIVVPTDNPNKKPKYPYFSYKFITLRKNVGESGVYKDDFVESLDKRFKYDVRTTATFQPKTIISFNCYSDDLIETQENILRAWEWFKLKGRRILANNNIVVVDVGNIQDRSIVLVDNYEYRQGFDVGFRVLHEFSDRFENIDSYKIDGKFEGGKK